MVTIADLIAPLKEFGIFEFYLPFLLLFAMFYALLTKTKIFGGDSVGKSVNVLFSLVAAFFLMAYEPIGVSISGFFSSMFASLSVVLVTIIGAALIIFLLANAVGLDLTEKLSDDAKKKAMKYLGIVGLLLILAIFITSGGVEIFPGVVLPSIGDIFSIDMQNINLGSLGQLQLTAQDIMILFLIGLTALAVWYVVSGDKDNDNKK